jgi:U32 family peptidase
MPAAALSSRSIDSPALLHRPEILAPAGDWECVQAAIENGADAIYFGLERFNARMRAQNFTAGDLPKLMAHLHQRGVRGYVTFNTLVFPDELTEAEDYLRGIIAAGVDAAIVQDVGICRLIRALSPDFPIHCSTQMTITSAAGLAFAAELGTNLVVLARENSLADIAAMQAAQCAAAAPSPAESADADRRARPAPMPLEVFVHGALCVAYSGQCLTSEALGGRSANRGECAQACRLPYELLADGKLVDLGSRRYLLSPQDLAALDVLPDLIRLGIASLKIEGRLKSAEYVAAITRAYRQAVDRLVAASPHDRPAPANRGRDCAPLRGGSEAADLAALHREHDYAMAMTFSRGLHPGWFGGTNNQTLVHANFGTKRGVFLGEIARVGPDRVALRLVAPLKPGDGLVFDAGKPEAKEEGGRVYQVEPHGAEMVLRFGEGDIDFRRVHAGDRAWKTSDPALEKRIRQTFQGDRIRFPRPVTMEAHGYAGGLLTVIMSDGSGHVVKLDSLVPLEPAKTQPLTVERLREQLGRLGGTPFRLDRFTAFLEGEIILPVSELNRLRRELVAGLSRLRAQPLRWRLNEPEQSALPASTEPGEARLPPGPPELIVVIRRFDQLEAAWSAGARTVYCDFEDSKRYRDAVKRFRELQATAEPAPNAETERPRSSIWVAPPRVFKPGEEWILNQVRSAEADGCLVRNYDHLAFFRGWRLRGDYSLNIANPLAARYFLRRYGLERVTASYDLNVQQLEALLRTAPPAWFELTLHQHMPMFYMEHCVFCAFLTTGQDYRDCGRPCDRHDLRLRDRVGAEFPVKADAGCRNTVFNNRAQTGAEYFARFLALGARAFRVEFLNETPEELGRTVRRYQQLLRGEISGAELWREFKLINQLGVTRGQMETAPPILTKKPSPAPGNM